MFLFDSAYVWDIVKLPGGVADLLGRFCTQFFLYAWMGAFIIAVLLTAVQLLTARLVNFGRLYALSFIPSFLLWVFMLDENALLGGVWAVLLTLFASWGCSKLADGWMKRIVLIIAVPVLYWIAEPVCVLLCLLQAPSLKNKAWYWYYGLFALLAVFVLVLANILPVPANRLWTGVHYHRYPTEIPSLLWAATLSVFVVVLALRYFCNFANPTSAKNAQKNTKTVPILATVLVAVCMGSLVWNLCNFKAEKTMKYDFMACHQQWNRILETVEKEQPNNQIGVTVQNLALAMHGMLAEHVFEYSQNGLLGLLPDVDRDAVSPMPTAEAFYQLGMINVTQRTVFEAQEAILDFQKSARCYKRLAQTNLINGDYEVARKYLLALQKTLFYSEWADETMKLLGDEKAINDHLEYGRLRKSKYDEDFYFSDHVTPEMLQALGKRNKENRIAYEYLMAYYQLTGGMKK